MMGPTGLTTGLLAAQLLLLPQLCRGGATLAGGAALPPLFVGLHDMMGVRLTEVGTAENGTADFSNSSLGCGRRLLSPFGCLSLGATPAQEAAASAEEDWDHRQGAALEEEAVAANASLPADAPPTAKVLGSLTVSGLSPSAEGPLAESFKRALAATALSGVQAEDIRILRVSASNVQHALRPHGVQGARPSQALRRRQFGTRLEFEVVVPFELSKNASDAPGANASSGSASEGASEGLNETEAEAADLVAKPIENALVLLGQGGRALERFDVALEAELLARGVQLPDDARSQFHQPRGPLAEARLAARRKARRVQTDEDIMIDAVLTVIACLIIFAGFFWSMFVDA